MKLHRLFLWSLTGLAVAAFTAGLVWLFALRFSGGDQHPRGSSLRSDPQGTRVLYESLARLPGVEVRRNFRELTPRDEPQPGALWLFLSLWPWQLETSDLGWDSPLAGLAAAGNTIVLALPATGGGWLDRPLDEVEAESVEEPKEETGPDAPGQESGQGPEPLERADEAGDEPAGETSEDVDEAKLPVRVRTLLDFETAGLAYEEEWVDRAEWVADNHPDLPEGLRMRAYHYLKTENPDWRVFYGRDGDYAFWLERPVGRGRMVVLASSYLFTNEAMAYDRVTALLTHLLGDHRRVVFNETHLGTLERTGVGTLLARYRLHGVLAALLAAALLWAWRLSSPLLPPEKEVREAGVARVRGRDMQEGFQMLLRRGVAPGELPATAWAAWKEGVLHPRRMAARWAEASREAEQALHDLHQQPIHRRNPLAALQRMARAFRQFRQTS